MLRDFIGVVIVVAVIVGFIVVFMAMYTAVLERTREIGIIKAVGGISGLVLSILLRETLMLAVRRDVAGDSADVRNAVDDEAVGTGEPGAGDGVCMVADCGCDCDCGRDAGRGGSGDQGSEAGCDRGTVV